MFDTSFGWVEQARVRNFCKYHDSIPIVGTKQENVTEKAKAWIKQIEQRRWPL